MNSVLERFAAVFLCIFCCGQVFAQEEPTESLQDSIIGDINRVSGEIRNTFIHHEFKKNTK